MSRARPPQVGPRHYHLLWDEELEALRPVLGRVLEQLGEVVEHWYQLYVIHFGETASLSELEFRDIFLNSLSRNTRDLLEGTWTVTRLIRHEPVSCYASGTYRLQR